MLQASLESFYLKQFDTKRRQNTALIELEFILLVLPSSVAFGSYPKLFHNYYKTKVTLESDSEPVLRAAEADLRSAIPEALRDFDPAPHSQTMDKIRRLLDSPETTSEFRDGDPDSENNSSSRICLTTVGIFQLLKSLFLTIVKQSQAS